MKLKFGFDAARAKGAPAAPGLEKNKPAAGEKYQAQNDVRRGGDQTADEQRRGSQSTDEPPGLVEVWRKLFWFGRRRLNGFYIFHCLVFVEHVRSVVNVLFMINLIWGINGQVIDIVA
jgi:hypothetical protein